MKFVVNLGIFQVVSLTFGFDMFDLIIIAACTSCCITAWSRWWEVFV